MNTGGPASEKTLRDEFAGQAMLAITISALSENTRTSYSIGNPSFLECLSIDAYAHADAMLAEKARREATGKDSLTVQTREFDDDRWAKFQDGFRISFQPTIGWCAEIRDGSMGYGNTIAEAIANLRARWEERSAAPVVQQSSTNHDDGKVAELQAANRELVEALDNLLAAQIDPMGIKAARACKNARAILAKHKGAA